MDDDDDVVDYDDEDLSTITLKEHCSLHSELSVISSLLRLVDAASLESRAGRLRT